MVKSYYLQVSHVHNSNITNLPNIVPFVTLTAFFCHNFRSYVYKNKIACYFLLYNFVYNAHCAKNIP